MSNNTKKRPVETLRDGAIKAAIWKNESENGVFYNVTFARTYQAAGGGLQDADSFSGSQLLKLARIADQAYARTRALDAEARQTDDKPEGPAPQDGDAAEKQPATEEAA